MSQYVAIAAQLLASPSSPDAADPWDAPEAGPAPPPSPDGTLLAVVPIPGTQTSLAVVGYTVPAPSGQALAGEALSGHALSGQALSGQPLAGQAPDAVPDPAADLVLDRAQRRVVVGGREIPLTYQEFELLAFLSTHPSTVFSRADLVRQVWQRDFTQSSRTVDVHISRLRHKLGPAYGRCLVTEYRVGYQFRPLDGGAAAFASAFCPDRTPSLRRSRQSPVTPSICSRRMSACPLCRAYSSIMCR